MNYEQLIKPYKDEMVETLTEFVSIPSVYDEKTKTSVMPFGENVDKALKFVGKLGEKHGFSVDYCDGYATELTIGKGEKLIGIFAHADVVPATGVWTEEPFKALFKDGKLIARGSSDDKGPFIAAFFAAKALFDNNLINDYRVRIVVGGNEESGSECLIHYFEKLHKEAPKYGFTPDSSFPLIYGEKYIADFYPTLKVSIPNIKSINGGVVSNAVCDNVKVVMEKDDNFSNYLKNKNIKFEKCDDGVIFIGKSSHGSMPQFGENAALICLKAIGDFYNIKELSNIGENLSDTSGKKFGCYKNSRILQETTFCVGMISFENDLLKITVNYRFGEEANLNETVKQFDKFFGTTSSIDEDILNCLIYEPDSFLVKTLLNAYQEETKDYRKHNLVTGGGTYAKHAPNTIAFGAEFPGVETKMHEPDEFIILDQFYKSSEIYARAIYDLGTKDEN